MGLRPAIDGRPADGVHALASCSFATAAGCEFDAMSPGKSQAKPLACSGVPVPMGARPPPPDGPNASRRARLTSRALRYRASGSKAHARQTTSHALGERSARSHACRSHTLGGSSPTRQKYSNLPSAYTSLRTSVCPKPNCSGGAYLRVMKWVVSASPRHRTGRASRVRPSCCPRQSPPRARAPCTHRRIPLPP